MNMSILALVFLASSESSTFKRINELLRFFVARSISAEASLKRLSPSNSFLTKLSDEVLAAFFEEDYLYYHSDIPLPQLDILELPLKAP